MSFLAITESGLGSRIELHGACLPSCSFNDGFDAIIKDTSLIRLKPMCDGIFVVLRNMVVYVIDLEWLNLQGSMTTCNAFCNHKCTIDLYELFGG